MDTTKSSRIPGHFMPCQTRWVRDLSRLKLIEKSRQVGITYADAYHSVVVAADSEKGLDVWISSRDKLQSSLYLRDCKHWAKFLHLAARDLGEIVLNPATQSSAYVLQFANDRRIYCLSSDPDALAGKRGHVKLDEFCLHPNQRELYRVAKGVTQWGGSLSIISTHRGPFSVFNRLIQDIKHRSNPMGWSFHSVSLETAVAQGIVERINKKDRRNESRSEFLSRLRAECIDEEQWLQDYCCTPADETSAFLSYEMIESCEDISLQLLSPDSFNLASSSPAPCREGQLYLGVDVARKHDLCVLDLGEKVGDVIWDRLRIELRNKKFAEIEFELYRLLYWPAVKRCCIDATNIGMHLAERAKQHYGSRIEAVTFTPKVKEDMAYKLRHAFEDRKLRIVRDDNLRADLRGIKKEVTSAGNIRFAGDAPDSHCDRFWAKALRQYAATKPSAWCPCPIVARPAGWRDKFDFLA